MEQTFMTIHNLGPDANILFASESITDILGYQPSEVRGKSAFDYFHPEEVPSARSIHSRGVLLDKAAVLHYARILNRNGRWIGCECCFTIVHDVLVACVSIYRRNAKSERRAIEAPQIRRIFACSPRDPRYHMLEHLSPKFKMPAMEREPRAALILNRFTRNLTIMFATTSICTVVGLSPQALKNKSFYRCIQESCLPEAIKCLESAKANDSIAYLRFLFQTPVDDDDDDDVSESMSDASHDSDDDDDNDDDEDKDEDEDEDMVDVDNGERRSKRRRLSEPENAAGPQAAGSRLAPIKLEDDDDNSFTLANLPNISHAPRTSARPSSRPPSQPSSPGRAASESSSIELEAVVSCTSDGLVVILRKARPPIPPAHPPLVPFDYGNGLFAAPWGQRPIRPQISQESLHAFQPPLLPQYMPLRENVKDAGGPPQDVLMSSIRDVAVFAWGVVGINPAMAAYGRGLPSGDARPANGSSQGYRPSSGSSRTNSIDYATTPAGSPAGSTTGLADETAAFVSPTRPMEHLHGGQGSYYSRARSSERPQVGPDHAPYRYRYGEMYSPPSPPPLTAASSPTGFAVPRSAQQPLPAFSGDPACQPAGYGFPTVPSSTPNAAGPLDDRLYGCH